MSDEIVSSSQTETVPEVFQDDSQEFDAREAFGLPPKQESKDDEESDEGERSVNDETPAKEDVKAETAKRVVKFNKEDREIDETEVDELLQKGLGLDQERARTKQREAELDRTAKILGFKDHSELTANLETLEKQQVQKQQTELDKMKNDLLDELVEVGNLDRAKAEEYIENHPLFQEGKKAIEERKTVTKQKEDASKWQPLYQAYPELAEALQKANGQRVEWFTPELEVLVAKGNDPLLAYEHLNRDKVKTQVTKSAEQKAIKDLQLGNRSKVETIDRGTQENQASEELRGAFSMFGIDPKRAQKYAK